MQWTAEDPGRGDLSGLEQRSRQLRERREHASDMVGLLSRAGMGMAEYWSGDAADEWSERVHDDLRAYGRLDESAETHRTALLVYIARVTDIKTRVATARGRVDDAQDATARLTRHPGEVTPAHQSRLDDAADEVAAGRRALQALAEERREADEALVRSLRALSESVRASKPVSAFNGSTLSGLTPTELLRRFSRLDGAQVMVVLDEHPELVGRLRSAAPEAVAAWWSSLSPDRQDELVESAPALIGNLDGVAFTARDAANRLALTSELVRVKASLAASKAHNASVAPVYRWDTAADLEKLAALEAVRGAAVAGPGRAQRFVLGLDLEGRPKAAISVGNPDTASQVTVNVPGMGTTVGGSMESWAAAAENLFTEQKKTNALYNRGRESGLATVAWIGYEAPDLPPSVQVLGMSKAKQGGARLSQFLDGVSATRGWTEGQNLSVVAHSYGTTTAAAALTTTQVESFTMLASAGLQAASVKDLNVSAKNVWATQAAGDEIANIGRGIATLGHIPVFTLPSTHQTDPTVPKFGANVFSSEDARVGNRKLKRSDGHSATPQLDMALGGRPTADVGYLDQGSTPLFNTSLTSLGLGDSGAVIEK